MSPGSDDAALESSESHTEDPSRLRILLTAGATFAIFIPLELALFFFAEGVMELYSDFRDFALETIFMAALYASVAVGIAVICSVRFASVIIAYLILSALTIRIVFAVADPTTGGSERLLITNGTTYFLATSSMLVVSFALTNSLPGLATDQLRLRLPARPVLAFGLTIAAWFFFTRLIALTPFAPVRHPDAPDYSAETYTAFGMNAVAFLAFIAVLVPVCEEIIFRGLILNLLRRATPAVIAVTISSLLFTVVHVDPFYFSTGRLYYIFGIGAIYAVSVLCTRSIWPAVTAHAINNALASSDTI